MLVTGRDLAAAWAVAAFTSSEGDAGIEVDIGTPAFPSAGVGTRISWRNVRNAQYNWGPDSPPTSLSMTPNQSNQLPSSPEVVHIDAESSTDRSALNQCVFVRCFRMKGRIVKKIVANAGPANLPGEDHDDFQPPAMTSERSSSPSSPLIDTDYGLG